MENSPTFRISKEIINQLPIKEYTGDIILINDDSQIKGAVEALKAESILGFDTETRPAFKKGEKYPVAVLQLATSDKVFLFQLLQLKQIEPLWEVLKSRKIIKAGVAIQDDIKKLQERLPFKAGSFIEIADITQKAGILNTGLRNLAAHYLGFRISKKAQVSNWAKQELTEIQLRYAATDAWVSRELFLITTK